MAQPVSNEWRAQIGRTAQAVARVDIIDANGAPQYSTNPATEYPLVVSAATVEVDRTRDVRGTASVTLHVQGSSRLIPRTAAELLSPVSGATFRLFAGFKHASGATEMVACGRYDIDECTIEEDAAEITISLKGTDLTGRLNVADLYTPVSINWGTNSVDAAKFLVLTAIPEMRFLSTPSDHTSAWVVLDEQTNRLQEINRIMASVGFEAFMDPTGEFMRMQPIPTTDDATAWSFQAREVGEPVTLTNGLSRARVFNGVVVKGENVNSDDVPVKAVLWDTDESSPTYFVPDLPVRTRIGPRPFFFTSQWIRTQEQADAAAEAQLRKVRGLLQRVSLSVPWNPAVNVGDVIEPTRPGLGVSGRYVVERISLDLVNPSPMELVCEERRV